MTLNRPPLIQTDLATSENFYTGTVTGVAPDHPAPRINTHRRFAQPGAALGIGIVSLAAVPAQFADAQYRDGLIALVRTRDHSCGGGGAIRAFIHAPAGRPAGYRNGWVPLPDAVLARTNTTAVNPVPAAFGQVVSQRSGTRSYLVLRDDTDLRILRVRGAAAIDPVHEIIGGLDTSWFVDNVDNGTDGGQLFVSDETQDPHIWLLSPGYHAIYDTDFLAELAPEVGVQGQGAIGPQAYRDLAVTVVRDHQSGAPPGNTISGFINGPIGWGEFGPVNGPPELWYLVPGSAGMFTIYRSRWGAGHWVRQAGYSLYDDAAWTSNATRYPALNPEGYAFDPNWLSDANRVGKVGPFVLDPAYRGRTYVRIHPDLRRTGVLHLILSQTHADYVDRGFGPPQMTGVQFAISGDDGATWSTGGHVATSATGRSFQP